MKNKLGVIFILLVSFLLFLDTVKADSGWSSNYDGGYSSGGYGGYYSDSDYDYSGSSGGGSSSISYIFILTVTSIVFILKEIEKRITRKEVAKIKKKYDTYKDINAELFKTYFSKLTMDEIKEIAFLQYVKYLTKQTSKDELCTSKMLENNSIMLDDKNYHDIIKIESYIVALDENYITCYFIYKYKEKRNNKTVDIYERAEVVYLYNSKVWKIDKIKLL